MHVQGVEFMQVKTLGAAHPSSEYAATCKFYEALGYRPLEEFDADTLWLGCGRSVNVEDALTVRHRRRTR